MTYEKNGSQGNKMMASAINSVRTNPITEKDKKDLLGNLRKSVIAVLGKSDNYSSLVEDPKAINSVSEAVFSSIYKKHGHFYKVKKSDTFDNLIDNIVFNTEKVTQVEEAKQQIQEAAEILASDEVETLQLNVVQASVHDKLDPESSKNLDFFESKFRKEVNDVVYAGSNIDLSKLPVRKDLLYLDLILVAEGTNKNKDTIPAEELQSRYLTLIGMPLVEEHITDAIRGVFYDSSLVRIKPGKTPGAIKIVESGGRLAVRAKAYVYKNRFPREAYTLKDKQSQGLLRYSVELAFGQSECSYCHAVFNPGQRMCEHLMLRNTSAGADFSRIVKDIYFIGGAYTQNPAEKDAISLDVVDPIDANKEKDKKNSKACVNNIDNTGKVIVVSSSKEESNQPHKKGEELLNNPNGGQRMFNFETVEELLASDTVSALVESKVLDIVSEQEDAFKASLEELGQTNEALTAQADELKASLDELETKLAEANKMVAELENAKKVSEAILDLQSGGYKFDSDDEITAFSDRIKNMSDEDAAFVIDLMKKQVAVASDETETEEITNEETASEEESIDESIEASQNADTNASAEETGTIAAIRKNWKNRIENLPTK